MTCVGRDQGTAARPQQVTTCRARADGTATEARDLVRRAVGDASGLTIKAQLRQAARNLGYVTEGWRVRVAWYGRAGRWVGTALHDLRKRFAAWREREAVAPSTLAQRVCAARRLLTELDRQVARLETDVALTERGAQS